VPVLVPMPAERPYSYAVPNGMAVRPGSIVRVPLGPREVAGIVWDGPGEAVNPKKLKADLAGSSTARRSTPDMRRLVDWVANYTLSPPGMVARMVLRVPAAFDPEPPIAGLRLTDGGEPDRMTDARRKVLELAGDGWPGRARAGPCGGRVADRGRRAEGAGLFLLDGVTGSGKTEVYFEAVAQPAKGPAGAGSSCPKSR
jgi:primosomal protein N' (replication factor Y) (superfamily II helicase)